MTAKPDRSEERDRALARLLVGTLRPAVSGEAAGDATCPDAGLMAAYADQGLADHERAQLDMHFATCGRCQESLALLGASLEARLDETPAEPFTTPAPPVAVRSAARPVQRWFWWLAPALGTAAAAMLWMVLRPASPGGTPAVQTAADNFRSADSLTAQANLPPPPAEAPPAAALQREAQTLDRLSRADTAAKETDEGVREQAFAQLAAPPAEAASAAPAARSEVTAATAPSAVGSVTQSVIEQAPPAGRSNDSALAGARAAAAPVPGPPGTNQRANDLPISGRNLQQLISLYRNSFTSPDGGALWRLGTVGSIERSTDRGQTWQPQASGVTTDLVSGSAASRDVAWLVGRAAVILRTTDGVSWQRVASPDGVTGDWAAVVAYGPLTASVVAADLRRFSTEDGGRTWTQQ